MFLNCCNRTVDAPIMHRIQKIGAKQVIIIDFYIFIKFFELVLVTVNRFLLHYYYGKPALRITKVSGQNHLA